MGKRYFCDYCERSFQDNLHNRKKHLNGVQHIRARKAWYDRFRDAAAVLQEEQNKKPCRKFLQTGQCDFGSNCRFSHLVEADLQALEEHVREEKRAADRQSDTETARPPGNIEDWLEKRVKRLRATETKSSLPEEEVAFQQPLGWPPEHSLPPSLRAPPLGGWAVPRDLHWG
ncbi:zinc finger matrin-type protein 5 isoform X2 [Anolis sagrei]|uniref:zinc finger matrin-type protein 5 isoform X2 n=1 Tax=Anolis sagrei TaxID=38937 RepID=UPI00295AFF2B|nr:zinc finger matrin-type protein 5 isoform X2 [Anolis sagrei ordinatus]